MGVSVWVCKMYLRGCVCGYFKSLYAACTRTCHARVIADLLLVAILGGRGLLGGSEGTSKTDTRNAKNKKSPHQCLSPKMAASLNTS